MPGRQPKPEDLATWGRSRAVRHPDFDYRSNAIIHLTICAHNSKPFLDRALADCVCEALKFRCRKLCYRLFGYCLMPDHLHIPLSPMDSSVRVDVWLQRFKSFTAHEYVRLGGQPPLWQRSAHDHVCRDGETAEALLAYIAENPVRAGLVERWQDWPWTKVFIEI